MPASVRVGLYQSISLGFVGLLVGSLAGWLGVFFSDELEGLGAIAANTYLALAALLPIALFVGTLINLRSQTQLQYAVIPKALTLLLIAASFGAVAASLTFLVSATNISAIFGQESAIAINAMLVNTIGWSKFMIVIITTIVSALPIAGWAYWQTHDSNSNS